MLENRQIVDVADGKNVTLIVVGAGVIRIQLVGIDKRGVIPVGRIVNRVTIGVCERELKSTRIPPAGDLQRVVVGDPSADNAIDRVVTRIGAVII